MGTTPTARAVEHVTGALNALVALVLLILFAPLLLLVAGLVRLSGPGPILFRQQRVGRFGVPFTIYKFRTMRVGAEHELEELVRSQGGSVGAYMKVDTDPRVTRIGAFLRATSLDELPQLLNVVKRDMNLVGPRPQIPDEVATYDHVHWRRLLVPPGITGLWQVSGRSDLSAQQALALDDLYVKQRTAFFDTVLLFRTVWAVVARRGAY
ncbi:MAG: sugar transferase [Actinomycetota bacterium]|nr:sugar transferase [Actinomycetota bacterium]